MFGPCFTAKTQRAWVTGRAFGFFFQGEAAARLALARKQQEDQLAAQRREAELRLATNQIENAKTTVAIQTAEEDARKVELRKKASEAAVQVKLAPLHSQGLLANRRLLDRAETAFLHRPAKHRGAGRLHQCSSSTAGGCRQRRPPAFLAKEKRHG